MQQKQEKLPLHIAVIMDGNGRWAQRKNLSRMEGHLEGAKSVRAMVENCVSLGIRHLTLYAFSTENWNRPRKEVRFLMKRLAEFLSKHRDEMKENGVRFRAIGRMDQLPAAVRKEIEITEKHTETSCKLQLLMAINYGARAEIAHACKMLCREAVNGLIEPDDIDEAALEKKLYTAGVPAPDLLIRTGGEMRLSNFLLWQLSYSEIYVTDTLWPDFGENELHRALEEYACRERRFGGVEKRDG